MSNESAYDDMERTYLLLNIINKTAAMGPAFAIIANEATDELKAIAETCGQLKADREAQARHEEEEARKKQLAEDEANNAADETPVLAVEELPPPTDEPHEVERRI